jgi:hypothetical protein
VAANGETVMAPNTDKYYNMLKNFSKTPDIKFHRGVEQYFDIRYVLFFALDE